MSSVCDGSKIVEILKQKCQCFSALVTEIRTG